MSSISKEYPLNLSPSGSGKVRIQITPSGAAKENVVYAINANGQHYAGCTKRRFGTRIGEHLCNANSKKDVGQRKVYRAVRKVLNMGQPATAKVLEVVPDTGNIKRREQVWIESLDAYKTGLNGNKGGGFKDKAKLKKKPFVPPNQTTPEKRYPLKRKAGRVHIDMTPSVKKVKNAIYRFKEKKTGQCYVGQSVNPGKRAYSHHWGINHPEKDVGQKKLYKKIRKNPEDFDFGVITTVDPVHLDAAEKHLIQVKNSYENGFNGNRGIKV